MSEQEWLDKASRKLAKQLGEVSEDLDQFTVMNIATVRISRLESELSKSVPISKLRELEAECERLQTKIDALMFEYCPDDMTAKQIHAYGIAQLKSEPLDIPAFIRRGKYVKGEG